ncbi:unnamed protein product [Schistocephalus solidus]|uniref:Trafficking protein particle complex subunit n=1 Tax=Schistocephalus solidus TaxID=70667 RepID=A0A183T8H8_SCHSO|nr:unnamed protein product [Schistocephalus solidus]
MTTVRAGQLYDEELDAATGDLIYVYYVHYLAPQTQHQDFTQKMVKYLTSYMYEITRGHFKKEPSQPDSQITSQPLLTGSGVLLSNLVVDSRVV